MKFVRGDPVVSKSHDAFANYSSISSLLEFDFQIGSFVVFIRVRVTGTGSG
jgi:hypothetical protein